MRHLRPAGKPAPPRPRRPEVLHGLDHGLDVAPAADAFLQQRVAAVRHVGGVVGIGFRNVLARVGVDLGGDFLDGGVGHGVLADDGGRRLFAAADAGGGDDAHVLAQDGWQLGQQVLGAGHFAGQAVAHAHRQAGGSVAAFLDDVEVVVEGGDFVHFRLRQLHLGGQGRQVARGQAVEGVLNLVQMFDQHVGRARAVAQQGAHFFERSRFDPAALGCFALALAAGAFDFDGDDHLVHAVSPVSGPGGPIRTTLVGVVSIKTPGGLAARPVSLAVYFRAVLRATALYC